MIYAAMGVCQCCGNQTGNSSVYTCAHCGSFMICGVCSLRLSCSCGLHRLPHACSGKQFQPIDTPNGPWIVSE